MLLTDAIERALESIPFDGVQLRYLESLVPKQQAIDADVRRAQIASLRPSDPVRRCSSHAPDRRLRDARCP
jgi:hypothetical protein